MSTANEVKKATKWGGREGYKVRPVHPLVAFVRALYVVGKNVLKPVYHAVCSIMYVYNKERGVYADAKFTAPISDPILDRMVQEGIATDYEMKKDSQKIILWRTADGRYFTESMIKSGKMRDQSQLTAACHISDEEADGLIMQLEAMIMETDLTEDESILLKELRRVRDARYAY